MELPEERGAAFGGGAGRETSDGADQDASAAGLGPRVTAVFTAAEQAADHILTMARAEAEDMRRRVEADIEAHRREQRAEAEAEARAILGAARAEADSIRAEARAAAQATEAAARTREHWVNEGIRLMTERAEWARQGLLEVVSRLEPFAEREPQEWREIESPQPSPSPVAEPDLADASAPEPARD